MSIPLRKNATQNRERGTVLVVMVAVLALMGAILLLGVGAFKTTDNADQVRTTAQREEFLMHELAAYAQRTNTVPCPANPATLATAANFGVADCTLKDGIIPFRTLNLSDYDARDAWGRYLTYRISPVLINTTTGAGVGNSIFMRCRRFAWYDGDPPSAGTTYPNLYPEKARFCCPPMDGTYDKTTDLVVRNAAGNIIEGISGRTIPANTYLDLNTPYGATAGEANANVAFGPVPTGGGFDNEEMFAVAIISHGQNGEGAYLVDGTANFAAIDATHIDEATNAVHPALGAAGNTVVDRPINTTAGGAYFDDIVLWRTQISLMATLNNATCYTPWR